MNLYNVHLLGHMSSFIRLKKNANMLNYTLLSFPVSALHNTFTEYRRVRYAEVCHYPMTWLYNVICFSCHTLNEWLLQWWGGAGWQWGVSGRGLQGGRLSQGAGVVWWAHWAGWTPAILGDKGRITWASLWVEKILLGPGDGGRSWWWGS